MDDDPEELFAACRFEEAAAIARSLIADELGPTAEVSLVCHHDA